LRAHRESLRHHGSTSSGSPHVRCGVLVDAARKKYARKRGGRDVVFVTLDDTSMTVGSTPDEVLALDAALEELARRSPRQARMVEYRFFGGLDVAETATLLEVSEATVLRDWRLVKAWLAKVLRTGDVKA
jgi:RNA polymerase sigma-70 factor, ECF subfamily